MPPNFSTRTVSQYALDEWGEEAQLDQAIEECGELIVAIRHYKRGRMDFYALLEEVADVKALITQIEVIAERRGPRAVEALNEWTRSKNERTMHRLAMSRERKRRASQAQVADARGDDDA